MSVVAPRGVKGAPHPQERFKEGYMKRLAMLAAIAAFAIGLGFAGSARQASAQTYYAGTSTVTLAYGLTYGQQASFALPTGAVVTVTCLSSYCPAGTVVDIGGTYASASFASYSMAYPYAQPVYQPIYQPVYAPIYAPGCFRWCFGNVGRFPACNFPGSCGQGRPPMGGDHDHDHDHR